jgi:serine/threonine protein kinase
MSSTKQYYRLSKSGGGILGYGAYGIVSDVCLNNGNSFCDLINEDDTICLYDENLIQHKVKTVHFLDWLKNDYKHNTIAKRFTIKEKFIDEIKENMKVIKIFKDSLEMITLDNPKYSISKEKTIRLSGVSINTGANKIYGIFGSKCNQAVELNFLNIIQFIENMLESIKVINDQNYYHNDIKLPNIVFCGSKFRFNLIDWGTSRELVQDHTQFSAGGGPIFSSPVKLYLLFKNHKMLKYLKKSNVPYITLKKYLLEGKKKYLDYINPGVLKVDRIKREKYNAIKQKLHEQHTVFLKVINGLTDEEIFEYFKKSFDVYMLGMTLLHSVYKFNLEHDSRIDVLIHLINSFISLEKPLNIDQAIQEFDKQKSHLMFGY